MKQTVKQIKETATKVYDKINKKKKPSKEESIKILECAYNNGIKIFDTAQAYGTAEEIIGEFIEKNKKVRKLSELIISIQPSNSHRTMKFKIAKAK